MRWVQLPHAHVCCGHRLLCCRGNVPLLAPAPLVIGIASIAGIAGITGAITGSTSSGQWWRRTINTLHRTSEWHGSGVGVVWGAKMKLGWGRTPQPPRHSCWVPVVAWLECSMNRSARFALRWLAGCDRRKILEPVADGGTASHMALFHSPGTLKPTHPRRDSIARPGMDHQHQPAYGGSTLIF